MVMKNYKSYQVRIPPVQIEIGGQKFLGIVSLRGKMESGFSMHLAMWKLVETTSTENAFNYSEASPRQFVLNTENQTKKVWQMSIPWKAIIVYTQ